MSGILNIHKWTKTLPIQGKQIRIRLFEYFDLSGKYISWLNDIEIVRYSNQRFLTHSFHSAEKYFQSFIGSPHVFLAIENTQNSQHIGTMTIYVQPYHHTADVGILIGERNKGYGTEAWTLAINWLLNTCQVRKVTAGTLACNHSMVRLMKQADMQHEATHKGQELIGGEPQDIIYFAKFRAN